MSEPASSSTWSKAAPLRADHWLAEHPSSGGTGIEWATLDLSGPYRKVFDTMLPDATQVADPFHLVKLANSKLDECRRRVQNETLGHRGRKTDPSTGRDGCSPRRMNVSTTEATPSCVGCCMPETRKVRCR
jgi:transposase